MVELGEIEAGMAGCGSPDGEPREQADHRVHDPETARQELCDMPLTGARITDTWTSALAHRTDLPRSTSSAASTAATAGLHTHTPSRTPSRSGVEGPAIPRRKRNAAPPRCAAGS